MLLQLQETDVKVLTFHGDEALQVQRIYLIWEGESETYAVLWDMNDEDGTVIPEGSYKLAWRGDWETCASTFMNLVGDLDAARLQALSERSREARREEGLKV